LIRSGDVGKGDVTERERALNGGGELGARFSGRVDGSRGLDIFAQLLEGGGSAHDDWQVWSNRSKDDASIDKQEDDGIDFTNSGTAASIGLYKLGNALAALPKGESIGRVGNEVELRIDAYKSVLFDSLLSISKKKSSGILVNIRSDA
jgi:hypothetical protein